MITLRGFPCESIGGNQAGKLLEARALYDICGSSGFLLLLNLSWDDSTDHDNDPDQSPSFIALTFLTWGCLLGDDGSVRLLFKDRVVVVQVGHLCNRS